ncbi:hypothetical protein CUMW_110640 [Citrus unshiu]|nr:hypothetical protein CUMW_110640 [Citrus unshiu]
MELSSELMHDEKLIAKAGKYRRKWSCKVAAVIMCST